MVAFQAEGDVGGGEPSTRERILGAALALFARKGFGATGIREIAAEAGVTTATLYHYAATKEDLLLTLMERGMDRLLGAVGEAVPALRTPEQKLVMLVQLHVVIHGTRQMSALVNDTELRALGAEHRALITAKRDEYERYWREALEEGNSRGVFEVEDAKLTSLALLEMCTGVAHWYSVVGPLSITDIALRFSEMALKLVGASRDGGTLRVKDLELPEEFAEAKR